MKAIGAKSWRSLERSARSVAIELEADYVLTPMRRNPEGSGYLFMPEAVDRLASNVTSERLGAAVRAAVERAE